MTWSLLVVLASVLASVGVIVVVASKRTGKRKLKRPNILFILADDMGYDDIGFMNQHEIDTPHLNALANDGVVLTQYYAQCVCSPSRAALMTGRYPIHNGVVNIVGRAGCKGLPLRETTIADVLTTHGYDTHLVGKWHLGIPYAVFTVL